MCLRLWPNGRDRGKARLAGCPASVVAAGRTNGTGPATGLPDRRQKSDNAKFLAGRPSRRFGAGRPDLVNVIMGLLRYFLLAIFFVVPLSIARGGDPSGPKKLIEWGWDEPDTHFLRDNIGRMERLPFDGVIFHMAGDHGENLTWDIWGTRPFAVSQFQKSLADLQATPFRRFTDRFVRVNVTPGTVDWFDDAAWRIVAQNFGVAAQLARDGGSTGIMFDNEQYQSSLFDYRRQKHRDKHSFAEYSAKVKQRGREWMQAVAGHYPNITVLLTFGYAITRPRLGEKDRSESDYGLWADFLDGMLSACAPATRIVDAFENSYGYRRLEQFQRAYRTIKEKSADWTGEKEAFRRHVRAGFGIWMDNDWNTHGWNPTDFSRNYFQPEGFGESVRLALRLSDEYVWIYTEKPRWWTNEKLPPAYVQALEGARKNSPAGAKP
jgi:hypothetical protein